jgi:hypothetical protein
LVVTTRISIESIVVASTDQISCDLAGEAAILQLKTGIYFGLDAVGATVWALLAEPRRVAEIRDAILDQYDVEAERCSRELLALLSELHAQRLVQVRDEANS